MQKRKRKTNEPKPEDLSTTNALGAQIALFVRHRAKARQGGRRSGATKINLKRNYVKIYGPGTEKGITGFPWNE